MIAGEMNASRTTLACRHCGYGYKGRGIYADHGLGRYNLEQHEGACLSHQKRRAARDARNARKYRRKLEKLARLHGHAAPLPGQFGFPFEGVPAIVS